ncbi:MAG: PKD domain-containing protein, partial [Bacteroidetes bacterium]|nr:PKD domain-containing protein [Bacteroidota bacterium]
NVTTNYTLFVTSSFGCEDTITQIIFVLLRPPVVGDTTICINDSITIGTPDLGYIYTWSPVTGLSDPNISAPNASPVVSTTYILSTDNGVCILKDTIVVNVSTNVLVVDFTADTTISCGPITVNFTNTSSGGTYLWDLGDNTTSTLTNPTNTYTIPGGYLVVLYATDSATCNVFDSASIPITVLGDTFYSLPGQSICQGDYVAIGFPHDTSLTYDWTPGSFLSDSTYGFPGANPPSTTLYTLIISNGVCTDTVLQNIIVGPQLVVDIGNDTTICFGDTVTIGFADQGDTYLWSPVTGLNNATISDPLANPDSTITYILNVNNGFCEKTDTLTITINELLGKGGPDTTICEGTTIQLGGPDEGYSYLWTPGTGLNDPTSSNPITTPTSTVTYVLIISDGFCTIQDSVLVEADC